MEFFVFLGHGIASGMEYIASKKILHGDLAARNVFLHGHQYSPRIADFGLAKDLGPSPQYFITPSSYVPWKWCAVEWLTNKFVTIEADVWSFGILIWEIFSIGQEPYDLPDKTTFKDVVEEGFRLSCPTDVSNVAWCQLFFDDFIKAKCWDVDATQRCSFKELRIRFEEISREIGMESPAICSW